MLPLCPGARAYDPNQAPTSHPPEESSAPKPRSCTRDGSCTVLLLFLPGRVRSRLSLQASPSCNSGACPWRCGGSQSSSRCARVPIGAVDAELWDVLPGGASESSFPRAAVYVKPLTLLSSRGNFFFPQMKNINAIKIIRDLEHPFVDRVACHSDRHNINS